MHVKDKIQNFQEKFRFFPPELFGVMSPTFWLGEAYYIRVDLEGGTILVAMGCVPLSPDADDTV